MVFLQYQEQPIYGTTNTDRRYSAGPQARNKPDAQEDK